MKTTRSSILRLALSAGLLLGAGLNADAAIKILQAVGPTDHIPKSFCPAGDGANILNPDPVVYLPPPGLFTPIRLELLVGDTAWPGWTFQKGPALKGTLTINTYKSVFAGDHYSGADIEAEYKPAATDPANLHFSQLVTTSDPAGGAVSPYMDPFPNDDDLPFYWTKAEETAMGTSLKFSDGSRRSHPPTSGVTWRGDLHITSWDGNTPGVVTIHDGIRWGFDAGCINWLGITMTLALTTPNFCVLTWPETTVPYRVETTTSVGPSAVWEPITGTRTETTNGQSRMRVPRSSGQQYFRLAITDPPLVPPTIESQPEPQTATAGAPIELEVGAMGTAELAYQWHHNGVPIPGATDSILTIAKASLEDQGQYTVTISNPAGSVTSESAMLIVQPANDTQPPRVQAAMAECPAPVIVVMFSEPVQPETAMRPGNYQIRLGPNPGPPVLEVQVMGPNAVRLFLGGTLNPSGAQLMVRNVRDLAGNVIAEGSVTPVNCVEIPIER